MPSAIYPAFDDLLLTLFLGTATAPAKLYIGLAAGTTEIGATDGGNPAKASGYARQLAAASETGGKITFAQVTFPAFTAIPSPNNATNWFVSDALTGGKMFFSGPLNPAAAGGTLPAATSGSTVLLPTSVIGSLYTADVLKLGSTCAGNLEYVSILSFGTDSGSNTPVTVGGMAHPHPSGEAWSRDGSVRTYTVGFVETVNAALSLGPGAA